MCVIYWVCAWKSCSSCMPMTVHFLSRFLLQHKKKVFCDYFSFPWHLRCFVVLQWKILASFYDPLGNTIKSNFVLHFVQHLLFVKKCDLTYGMQMIAPLLDLLVMNWILTLTSDLNVIFKYIKLLHHQNNWNKIKLFFLTVRNVQVKNCLCYRCIPKHTRDLVEWKRNWIFNY